MPPTRPPPPRGPAPSEAAVAAPPVEPAPVPPVPSVLGRWVARIPRSPQAVRAAGAVTAQFSQALASFLLTVLGVRSLDVADFGVLALLLGGTVLATALMTGFIGDSLTVLDRADPATRGGLQVWCLGIAGGLVIVGAAATTAFHLLSPRDALVFGLGLAAFTIEDTARRTLMACLRFWSIVAVDLAYLLASAVVLASAYAGSQRLQLVDFLLALLLGQLVATVVALVLLPREERRLAPFRGADVRAVAAFGAWRATHQAVRPGALVLVRVLILAGAGATGLAHFETARVYTSPAVLLVLGTGGFFLATAARRRSSTAAREVRSADRAALVLAGLAGLVCLTLYANLSWLGGLLTGSHTRVDPLAVAGWAAVALSSAVGMPYSSLATVRCSPRTVLALRLVDQALSLSLVGALLALRSGSSSATPFALAVGGVTAAVLQRWLVLSRGT